MNSTDFIELDKTLFDIPKTYNLFDGDLAYAQTRFRGFIDEINKLTDYLDASSIEYEKLTVSQDIAEVRMSGEKSTPILVQTFPVLKATGLCEDFRRGQVDAWISESGFSVATDNKLGGYFDGHHEGGMGRWAWEYDMMDRVIGKFVHLSTDETTEVFYIYPFKDKWNDDKYLFEIDGNYYGRKDHNSEEFDIVDNTIIKYKGFGGSIKIPEGITDIKYGVFSENKTIQEVQIPGSLKKIPNFCFYKCSGIKKIVIDEGVEEVGESAFSACKDLRSILFPKSLRALRRSCFDNCTSIKEVILPEGLEEIDDLAFSGCYNIRNLYLPNSLRIIDSLAFNNCTEIDFSTLNISENLISIGWGNLEHWINVPPILYNKGETSILYYSPDNKETQFALPETVKHIGKNAFINCKDLRTIILPNSLISIGIGAFSGCDNLEEVDIPSRVNIIGSYAFSNCSLDKAIIPSGVHEIGQDTFCQNLRLKEVVILGDIEKIGENAFANCTALREIIIPDSVREIAKKAFCNTQIRSIAFGDNLKLIGEEAFAECRQLEEIKLPRKMDSIMDRAFADCTSLSDVLLPEEIDYIGNKVLYNTGITTITIPQRIKEISVSMFQGCKKLISVVIEDGIQKVGGRSFSECPELREVRIKGALKKKHGAKVFYKSQNVIVYGIPGTKAEDLARDNNVPFRPLD